MPHTTEQTDMYAHYVSANANLDEYGVHECVDLDGNPCVELWFSRDMAKCFIDDSHFSHGDVAVLQVLLAGTKQAVVKRETDLLTPDELRAHAKEVAAAILEELTIWVKYSCFERRPKKGARNVMDSRYVAKWKMIKGPSGTLICIIRMRMALRGFKDIDAASLLTYSATAARASQRIIASETACHPDWIYVAVDINKAFLQGMTYKELGEATGEPERIVNFTLPPGSAAILRQLPGFEDFDEYTEVLGCVKPGTGCKDAPRASSLQLAAVTQSEDVGMVPTTMDRELQVKHVDGKLVAMQSKHVGDVKIGGEPPVV